MASAKGKHAGGAGPAATSGTKIRRFRLLTGLSYPTDEKIIKKLQAGEKIPFEAMKMKYVPKGKIVSDIPKTSIPWLLERGKIEEVK